MCDDIKEMDDRGLMQAARLHIQAAEERIASAKDKDSVAFIKQITRSRTYRILKELVDRKLINEKQDGKEKESNGAV